MTFATFDIEIRAFSRSTGIRLNFNPKLVLSGVTWSYVERGGAEMATIPIAVPFEQIPVANGDFIEIWALNDGSTVPRWRGVCNVPERILGTKEEHVITAYGRMEDMSHVVLNKIITHPATLDSQSTLTAGADLCIYAADIHADYVAALKQSNAAYQPWLSFTTDFASQATPSGLVGINLVQLSAILVTARAAMDALADQGGSNIVWGWDIDPVTGVDRFYMRPRN